MLTNCSFLCGHSETELFYSVDLGLLSQQRPQSAPQDKRDTPTRHCSISWCLRCPDVRRQLHQQGQESREVGFKPGAAQSGDKHHVGLRGRGE